MPVPTLTLNNLRFFCMRFKSKIAENSRIDKHYSFCFCILNAEKKISSNFFLIRLYYCLALSFFIKEGTISNASPTTP